MIERDGVLLPLEIKKGASPGSSDTKNFSSLDAVSAGTVPVELEALMLIKDKLRDHIKPIVLV